MYKAIFVDVDGTILDSKKELREETKKAINLATKNGIKVIMCSGRQYNAAKQIVNECDFDKYIICTNGAEIYDINSNEVLFNSIIEKKTCFSLYKIAVESDIIIKFDCKYGRFVYNSNHLINTEMELDNEIEKFFDENDITQISVEFEDKEKIENMKNKIKQFQDLKISNEFVWNIDGDDYYTVAYNNRNTSKGNAMMGLCKFLKIDLNDVIAIGDGINDISMIQNAGYGVSMGNAYNEVKEIADYITVTNDENGVAKIIEKILS